MKKRLLANVLVLGLALGLTACAGTAKIESKEAAVESRAESKEESKEAEIQDEVKMEGKITLAAAASLEKSFVDKIIPMFNEKYPDIEVVGTYDSSGKLKTQIEEGAEVDVFFSAATKQMDALNEAGLMNSDSIVKLLENKIVFIVPKESTEEFSAFEDIAKADTIAIGDPESVPAGQYAKEALTNLGLWEEVEKKASLGTNVTEVLNWVAQSSASAGIVYATDAAKMVDEVKVIAQVPADSVKPAIYPVGITKESKNLELSEVFVEFLKSEEIKEVFTAAGFTIVE